MTKLCKFDHFKIGVENAFEETGRRSDYMPRGDARGIHARRGVRVLNCVVAHVEIGCRPVSLIYRVVSPLEDEI